MHHVLVHAERARQLAYAARPRRVRELQQNRQNVLRRLVAVTAGSGSGPFKCHGRIDHAAGGGYDQDVKFISHTITLLEPHDNGSPPMIAASAHMARVEIAGVAIELAETGKGRPLVFLHGGHPSGRLEPQARVVEALGESFRVIAPTHPGFGATPEPPQLTTIDDLAYLYLDLLDALHLKDVVLVGASLGGWIAAEMAVKTTERLSSCSSGCVLLNSRHSLPR